MPALHDSASVWGGTVGSVVAEKHFFRPIALLTFKLQFLLFGHSPVAAHAIGLVLHASNTFLVAWLAARLQGPQPSGAAAIRVALTGLLYGLHPALIEPVSWMSCRFDLLVTFWLLLALHADFGIRAPLLRAPVVAALFALALCSKEMAAPFPAVLALFQLATRYRDVAWRDLPRSVAMRDAATYALLVLAGLGYVALRSAFVGGAIDVDPDVADELADLGARAAFVASTILFHLRNIVWPFDVLNPLHPVDLAQLRFTAGHVPALVAAVAIGAGLGFGVWRRNPAVALAAAALVALVPVLNLVPVSIGRNIGHERYLTFPLSLMVLAVSVLPFPARSSAHFRVAAGGAGALGLVWFALAVVNVRVTVPLWQSDVTLWSWAYARNPGSDYAHYSLVTALLRDERLDVAARYFTDTVPATPYRALTELIYARHLIDAGRLDEGVRHLRRALQGFPPWHLQPPAAGRDARDYDAYRAHVADGYGYLEQVERHLGHEAEARAAAAIAAQYSQQEIQVP